METGKPERRIYKNDSTFTSLLCQNTSRFTNRPTEQGQFILPEPSARKKKVSKKFCKYLCI